MKTLTDIDIMENTVDALNSKENRKYTLLLAAVIIARSSSYLFFKVCLMSIGVFTLLGIRFLLAFALLLMLFWSKLRDAPPHTIVKGFILGLIFFTVMSAELLGLRTTNSSTASFLENTAIIIVPLLEAGLHKKLPKCGTLFCCALTLSGIAFLTLKGNGFMLESGELLCLLAAIIYAVAIITTDRFSHKDDPLILGIFQVGTVGVLGMVAAFIFESPSLPSTGQTWIIIIYLATVCTGFGFTLQPLAQSRTSSEQAGIFCALTPLTASILGVFFLHEQFSLTSAVGAALIICSIVFYGRNAPL